jgi:hypothetical protein
MGKSAHIRYRRRRRQERRLRQLEETLRGEPRTWAVLLGYDSVPPVQVFKAGKVWPSRIWATLRQHAGSTSDFSLLIEGFYYAELYSDLRWRALHVGGHPLHLHILTYVHALERARAYTVTAWTPVAVATLSFDLQAVAVTWVL